MNHPRRCLNQVGLIKQTSVLQLLVLVGEPVDKEIQLVTKLDREGPLEGPAPCVLHHHRAERQAANLRHDQGGERGVGKPS